MRTGLFWSSAVEPAQKPWKSQCFQDLWATRPLYFFSCTFAWPSMGSLWGDEWALSTLVFEGARGERALVCHVLTDARQTCKKRDLFVIITKMFLSKHRMWEYHCFQFKIKNSPTLKAYTGYMRQTHF